MIGSVTFFESKLDFLVFLVVFIINLFVNVNQALGLDGLHSSGVHRSTGNCALLLGHHRRDHCAGPHDRAAERSMRAQRPRVLGARAEFVPRADDAHVL